MKGKLTKITGIYTFIGKDDKMIASDDKDMQKDYQIGKLSKQNCDEIFGVIDVDGLARKWRDNSMYRDANAYSYKAGYNKAMELNKDKVFTLEDMKNAFYNGWNYRGEDYQWPTAIKEYLQHLQQPTEIEVEVEMINSRTGKIVNSESDLEWDENGLCDIAILKLDEKGCLILKKL
jgi:hypothetical protein